MSLLLLFIDGIGLGGSDNNPLCSATGPLRIMQGTEESYNFAGGILRAADATMGVPGLPQSATGQTAIFTGVNTARLIGRHLSGWPNARLRDLLQRDSIFIRLTSAGLRAAFANAFSTAYFLRPVNRMSASTLHMLYAGLKPRWIWQIPAGEAVFQDFTNKLLADSGFPVPEQTPEAAGQTLAAMLEHQDFVLYEFFITDAAAHRRIRIEPAEVITLLEKMISSLLHSADLRRHCIALCSDHGNIEDSTSRSHTRNPIPLLAWGDGAVEMFHEVTSISGIANAVCRRFGITIKSDNIK
jgi:2,3-bisphosphoglycerate-independent phosphoglycerate mutase